MVYNYLIFNPKEGLNPGDVILYPQLHKNGILHKIYPAHMSCSSGSAHPLVGISSLTLTIRRLAPPEGSFQITRDDGELTEYNSGVLLGKVVSHFQTSHVLSVCPCQATQADKTRLSSYVVTVVQM